jgi:hypothetical protein
MALRTFRPGRADTYQARMKRARDAAYSRGFLEAKLFKLAVGGVFEREQVLDWLSTVIDDGRAELKSRLPLKSNDALAGVRTGKRTAPL